MQFACTKMLPVACLVLQYFFTLFHKWHISLEKKKSVFRFSLQILSETFLILRRIE